MSKVYEAHLEMEELNDDTEYQEHLLAMEELAKEEAYGQDQEETKAIKFAKMLIEDEVA